MNGYRETKKKKYHPEQGEGSRQHPLDATEILRHFVPLNDKLRFHYLLLRNIYQDIQQMFPELIYGRNMHTFIW